MDISRKSKSLPIAVAMALFFWVGSATAQEQRCNELGSVCQCSERLDTNAFAWDNTPQASEEVNPTDTNSKQCRGGKAIQVGEQNGNSAQITYLLPTAETGMPAVNSVNYVWRWNRGQGYILGYGNTPLQPSTKRLCYRHYLRMSPNYDGGNIATDPTSPNCDAGKFNQQKWSQTYDLQSGSAGCAGRNCDFAWGVPGWPGFSQPGNVFPADIDFNYSDCYGQWCRFETCVSGDFAGGTGNFFAEGYIRRLSDGKQRNWRRYNLGAGNPGLNMGVAPWIVNGFRGDANDPGTCTNGFPQDATNRGAWREVSYLMQAEWPVDVSGTFIGPAREIEGAAGSPPPPPPGSTLGKPGTPTYQAP